MSDDVESEVQEQQPPAGAVVAGVDGGELDVAVLTAAAAEAIRRSVPLHVRYCRPAIQDTLAFASAGAWIVDDLDDGSGEILAAAAETVKVLDEDLRVSFDRPRGRPENLLVGAGDDAALLVVGTGRASRLEEWVLGTVALDVAAHAACPVLVVPPGADPDGAGDVVVGVDGSDHSRAALTEAARIAAELDVRLVVVTTWTHRMVDGYVVTEPDSPEWKAVEDEITGMQRGLLRGVDVEDVDVDLRVLKGGIRQTLAAASDGARVIVVGNRGRGGFASKALGSVTMDLLKRSACPVLVVHHR